MTVHTKFIEVNERAYDTEDSELSGHWNNAAKTYKLLTYNVLWSDGGRRGSVELFKLLEQSDADVITLQEVSPWFCGQLQKQVWMKKYHHSLSGGSVVALGGMLILSKNPITDGVFERLKHGRQRRGLLAFDTSIAGIPVTVATCHLESFLEAGPTRALQIKQFLAILKTKKNVIFMGDFNFGDGEKETEAIPKDYADAWRLLHKKSPGFTWDRERSPLAKSTSFVGEKSRRLDRVFIASKLIKATQCKIIGNTPIKGSKDVFPSDHFGLECVIEILKK